MDHYLKMPDSRIIQVYKYRTVRANELVRLQMWPTENFVVSSNQTA
jgi:hypothetical protein